MVMKRILVVLSCAICAVSSAENLRDTLITRLNNADFGLVECIAGIERIEDEVDASTDAIHILATSHSDNGMINRWLVLKFTRGNRLILNGVFSMLPSVYRSRGQG